MIFKTEYASSYIWHENGYSNKPERQLIRGRFRNSPLFSRHKGSLQQLSQPQLQQQQQQQQLLESMLYFSLHPSPASRHEDVKVKDENQIKSSSEKKPPPMTQRQRHRSSSTRRYSLDADARGINSHFQPASLEVLLDLGINSCKSTTCVNDDGGDGGNNSGSGAGGGSSARRANQYFTSVYKSDFSCTKRQQLFTGE